MSNLLKICILTSFVVASVKCSGEDAKSFKDAIAPVQGRQTNNRLSRTKDQKLLEAVEEVYRRSAKNKAAMSFLCDEKQYFDPVSESCQSCMRLCQHSSPKFCQFHCPWFYAETKFYAQTNKLWIATGISFLLVILFGISTVYLLFKQNKKKVISSEDESLLESNKTVLHKVIDSEEDIKNKDSFVEVEIVRPGPELISPIEEAYNGRTETENGRLVTCIETATPSECHDDTEVKSF